MKMNLICAMALASVCSMSAEGAESYGGGENGKEPIEDAAETVDSEGTSVEDDNLDKPYARVESDDDYDDPESGD